jgi:hypothetical protein
MEKFLTIFSKLTKSISTIVGVGVLAGVAETGVVTLFKSIQSKFLKNKKQETTIADKIMRFFHINGMSREKKAFLFLLTRWISGPGSGLIRPLIALTGRKVVAASPVQAIIIQLISIFLIPFVKNTARNKFNIR